MVKYQTYVLIWYFLNKTGWNKSHNKNSSWQTEFHQESYTSALQAIDFLLAEKKKTIEIDSANS